MPFRGLFGREEDEEEFVEIEKTADDSKKVQVMIESLEDYRDVERVQKLLREGNIVFLKIKPLKDKDLGELKRSVQRLKKTCTAMNGDIVGVDEHFLVLTPPSASVYRGEQARLTQV